MNDRYNIRLIILTILLSLSIFSCINPKQGKQPVLLADREAPLGWIYLKMYNDNSFEFISYGLRDGTVFPGTFRVSRDTIFFTYKDSIPRAGKTAVIGDNSVSYFDGEYSESVEIKLNKLKK